MLHFMGSATSADKNGLGNMTAEAQVSDVLLYPAQRLQLRPKQATMPDKSTHTWDTKGWWLLFSELLAW